MKYVSIFLGIFFVLISCNKKTKSSPEESIIQKDTISVVENKVEEIVKTSTEQQIEDAPIIFTVQIAALHNPNSYKKEFKNADVYKEGDFTKYRLGHFNTYKEARSYRKKLLVSYPGAFVQALQNDEPIHISKVLE